MLFAAVCLFLPSSFGGFNEVKSDSTQIIKLLFLLLTRLFYMRFPSTIHPSLSLRPHHFVVELIDLPKIIMMKRLGMESFRHQSGKLITRQQVLFNQSRQAVWNVVNLWESSLFTHSISLHLLVCSFPCLPKSDYPHLPFKKKTLFPKIFY